MINRFGTLVGERGGALLIALSLIIMLSTVAMMSFQKSVTDVDLSFNDIRYEQAMRLADAGLERAMVELNTDAAWRSGLANEALGNGTFSVAVLDSSAGVASGDTLVLRSTAATNSAPKSVVVLERWLLPIPDTNPFKWAVFGDDSLLMKQNACTDSYNSDSGTYAATMDTLIGDVGSNGLVSLINSVSIGGDALTSDPGSITMAHVPTVYGDTSSAMPPQSIDPIPDAEFTDAQTYNTAPAGISGTYSFNPAPYDLVVDANHSITLASGTYYFKSIDVRSCASINLAPGADVTIYVDSCICVGCDAAINAGGCPADCVIKSRGTELDFESDSEFCGAIYAPNVDFVHGNSASIYGSVVARKIELMNAACVHYDRALLKAFKEASGNYAVIGWREL